MLPLSECVNDAKAMSDLLGQKGYDVTLLLDATTAVFRDQLRSFAESLCSGDTVVVHFSGHRQQQQGGNRLVFVDDSELPVDVCGETAVLYVKFSEPCSWIRMSCVRNDALLCR
jgi:uncharacterized caspase-like protein